MTVLRKVGIIGIGHVGAHVANAVLSAGLAEELKLCDINEQKAVSECQDLSDTLGFYPHNCVIGNYGTQYEQLADCDVVINAAGDVKTSAKDRDGELFVTTDIARTWISRLFNAGFHGVIITISNPCGCGRNRNLAHHRLRSAQNNRHRNRVGFRTTAQRHRETRQRGSEINRRIHAGGAWQFAVRLLVEREHRRQAA